MSGCAEILLELKTKTDSLKVNTQLQSTDADKAVYTGIEEAARVIITR